MEREDKETIFQILSAIAFIVGFYTGDKYVLIISIGIIFLSISFWYRDNLIMPIKLLQEETKMLHKDLNMRKEVEDVKLQLALIKMQLKESKKGGLDPTWFIVVIVIIILIMFYLRDKGLI
jgi:hypothetical protein